MGTSQKVALALDCGSHAVRLIGYPEGGAQELDLGALDITSLYPHPGHVEVDAESLVNHSVTLLRNGLKMLADQGKHAVCLAITNMRETAIAWDRHSGKAIHNGIHWMSTQSQVQVDRWEKDGTAGLIREKTGLSNQTFFFGSKVRWLLEHSEHASALAASGNLQLGTVESWLAYSLSGGAVRVSDTANASRYQLLNIHTIAWDEDLTRALGVPLDALPEVTSPHGIVGFTDPELVGQRIPITGLIGDQQASLLGHGAVHENDVKATFGTSGVVCANIGHDVVMADGLVTSIAWSEHSVTDVVYEMEASAFHSASTMKWLSERLLGVDLSEAFAAATGVPAEYRPYVIPAFSQLGAPRWPRRTGGAVVGLQLDSNNHDIMRAGLESMAFQTFDTLSYLGMNPATISVDGGGSASDYLCQSLANLTNAQVSRPVSAEITSRGAAHMAVKGLGEDPDAWLKPELMERTVFDPQDDSGYIATGYGHWVDLVERLLGDHPAGGGPSGQRGPGEH